MDNNPPENVLIGLVCVDTPNMCQRLATSRQQVGNLIVSVALLYYKRYYRV